MPVVVSTSAKRGRTVFPAGNEVSEAVTDIESPAADAKNDNVAVAEPAVAVSVVSCVAVAEDRTKVSP